jgi:hypothetical protein
MNAFAAAEQSGRADERQQELEALFEHENRSSVKGDTSIPATSGRLICCHVVFVRIMALSIVSRRCIQATSATFFGSPSAASVG